MGKTTTLLSVYIVVTTCFLLYQMPLTRFMPKVSNRMQISNWTKQTELKFVKEETSNRISSSKVLKFNSSHSDIGIHKNLFLDWKEDGTKNLDNSITNHNSIDSFKATVGSKQHDKVQASKPRSRGKKYLIYFCDRGRGCGGMSDRQRGIASAFLQSFQYNRTFGIIMSTPCDIRQVFLPNIYDWDITESALIGKSQKIIDVVNKGNADLSKETAEVIYLRTNSPLYFYTHRKIMSILPGYLRTSKLNKGTSFKLIWNALMRPTRHMQEHLAQIPLNEKLVCAHVRIGKSKNLPNDPERLNIASIPTLFDFISKFDRKSRIFIATDNKEVRESARKRFKARYFDTGGLILHMDRQKSRYDGCLGFETSILDQMVLSKCNVLIVSPSGFSVRAAMLRETRDDLYIFNGSNIKPFTIK